MKKLLCWIVLVSLVAFAPLAAATTYLFTSPTYTFASGSYTTAMRLTGAPALDLRALGLLALLLVAAYRANRYRKG